MAKARIAITYTLEFDIDRANYPDGCKSDMECLAFDIRNYSEPDVAVEAIMTGRNLVNMSVTGELVKEVA